MSTQSPPQLAKTYSPAETEPRIRQKWDEAVCRRRVGGVGGAGLSTLIRRRSSLVNGSRTAS